MCSKKDIYSNSLYIHRYYVNKVADYICRPNMRGVFILSPSRRCVGSHDVLLRKLCISHTDIFWRYRLNMRLYTDTREIYIYIYTRESSHIHVRSNT